MNVNKKLDQYLESKQDQTNWTPIIKFVGAVIYLTGLIYAGSHVFSFIGSIMTVEFLRVMGYVGGVGIILNGAVLPLAIHQWTMEKAHRAAAMGFYALDIFLIAGFVWANTNITRGTGLALADTYMNYISPLAFLNTILTWGILTILDPENRMKYKINSAYQEAEHIKIKAGSVIAIAQAEQESQTLLLQSGVDLDNQNTQPEPTRTFSNPLPPPPEPNPWPVDDDFYSGDIWVNDLPQHEPDPTRTNHNSGTPPKV